MLGAPPLSIGVPPGCPPDGDMDAVTAAVRLGLWDAGLEGVVPVGLGVADTAAVSLLVTPPGLGVSVRVGVPLPVIPLGLGDSVCVAETPDV